MLPGGARGRTHGGHRAQRQEPEGRERRGDAGEIWNGVVPRNDYLHLGRIGLGDQRREAAHKSLAAIDDCDDD